MDYKDPISAAKDILNRDLLEEIVVDETVETDDSLVVEDAEEETNEASASETPTLDTKSIEDTKLYDDGTGKGAKIDTDKGTEGKDKKNKKSIENKAKGKGDAPVPAKEHLEVLFATSSDDLSEDFKNAATTIFEAAIAERVSVIEEELKEDHDKVIAEHTKEITDHLTERLDDYLNYVVEEWMKENELAVENGIRSDIAESFITGLKELFENNSITIPDENYELLEGVVEKAEELEKQLNTEIETNMELKKEISESKCDNIFHEVSNGLVDTEVEKLRKLSDGIEFENAEQYEEKLNIIKESYFGESTTTSEEPDTTPTDETYPTPDSHNAVMDRYVKSIKDSVKD
ncbi:MAG: hypothetical protein HOC18_04055 [Candidatus Marinimicrobia bacterium]|jgi:hypothetical protein|nr:hypothetical protein [Candidatus Neomarinimicrobiota bacterium]